jgi:hypothetical protein
MRGSLLFAVLAAAASLARHSIAADGTNSIVGISTFLDLTAEAGHPDLSDELQSIVEKHCAQRGIKVMPHDAVLRLFEAAATNGTVEEALWLIDGRCQWSAPSYDRLHVALRLQKVGFEPGLQEFSITPAIESGKTLLENLDKGLTSTGFKRIGWAINADTLEGERRAMLREPLPRSRVYGDSPEAQQLRTVERKQMLEENLQMLIERYEAALRRNPDDMESRYMLGMALFSREEPERQRGREMLEAFAKGAHPDYARRAATTLGAIERLREAPAAATPNYPRTRNFVALARPNSAAPQSSSLSEPILWRVFSDRVVLCADGERLLIADGKELLAQREGPYNPDPIPLPVKLTSRITAIETSQGDYWIGTERDGLLQVAKTGNACKHFQKADGTMLEEIQSLCVEPERVWLGFGSGFRGGAGVVYLADGECTRFLAGPDLFGARAPFSAAPEHAVHSIAAAKDGVLVASRFALQFYDPAKERWHLTFNERVARVASSPDNNYVAAAAATGNIWLKKVDSFDWRFLDLGEQWPDNRVEDLQLDAQHLWAVAGAKIYRINLAQLRIEGIQKLGSRHARQILVNDSAVLILTGGIQPGTSDLLFMRKPAEVAQR